MTVASHVPSPLGGADGATYPLRRRVPVIASTKVIVDLRALPSRSVVANDWPVKSGTRETVGARPRDAQTNYGELSSGGLDVGRPAPAPPRRRGSSLRAPIPGMPTSAGASAGRCSAIAVSVASVKTTYAGTCCSPARPRQLRSRSNSSSSRSDGQSAQRPSLQPRRRAASAADPAARLGRRAPAAARRTRRRRAAASGDQPVAGSGCAGRRRAPARLPGQRPGQQQLLPGPGDPDVEQPALLLDRLVGGRRAGSAACRRPGRPGTPRPTPGPWPRAARPASRPATVGACAASARSSSSAANRRRSAAGSIGGQLLGQPDQREQRLPPVARAGTAGGVRR